MAKQLVALSTVVFVAGCIGGGGPGAPAPARPVQIDSLTFEMAATANGRRPARVGLVQFEDPSLAEQLVAIPPAEWFGPKGEAFRNAHPAAYYDDWELVPGLVAGPFNLRVEEYVAAILFCDTDAAAPPLRIEEDGDLAVHIEPDGCEVYPVE